MSALEFGPWFFDHEGVVKRRRFQDGEYTGYDLLTGDTHMLTELWLTVSERPLMLSRLWAAVGEIARTT